MGYYTRWSLKTPGPMEGGGMNVFLFCNCASPAAARRCRIGDMGFTLVELLMVMALIGILTAVSVPYLKSLVQSIQIKTNTRNFYNALAFTRSEAVRRGGRVSMCSSTTGTSCTSSSWASGWVVFADPNNPQTIDAGETIIKVHESLGGTSTTVAASVTVISYLASGILSTGTLTSFKLCDSRGASYGTILEVTATGRIKSKGTPASCS